MKKRKRRKEKMNKQIMYEGPDISYHNGNVDIKQIRDAGCKRVAIRAGYGKNNVDQKYVSNALACYNLGVDTMLYWFSYAYTKEMAAAEAEYAIVQAKKYWTSCPIAYDFEYDSVNYARKNGVAVTKELATDMAIAFLLEIKKAGYIPVLYTNKDYLKNYFDTARIAKEVGVFYLWYARYNPSIPDSELDVADIWQYTSTGLLPGIKGNVDLNHFYTDFGCKSVKAKREDKCNINILDFQKAANADGYRDKNGNKLVEDGIDGPNTQYVRKQIALKARHVGESIKVGSTGELVSLHQRRLNEILEISMKVDGKYGQETETFTMALQHHLSLSVDGIAGYNTLQSEFYN